MEIFPCRYLSVKQTVRKSETAPPSEPNLLLTQFGRWFVPRLWTVAGALLLAIPGYAFSMLGYQQPSFALARLCFAASSAILFLAIAITAACIDAQIAVRVVVATLGAGVGGLFLIVGLLWTSLRQIDFDRHQRPATVVTTTTTTQGTSNTTTTTPDTPQSVPPSATHTAADAVAPVETFKPGSGTREDPYTNADVWRITEPYDSRTSVEAGAITSKYRGQWMRIDSSVYGLDLYTAHSFMVGIQLEDKQRRNHMMTLFAFISDTKSPAVKVLRRGDHVVVLGKIDSVDFRNIILRYNCELIEP